MQRHCIRGNVKETSSGEVTRTLKITIAVSSSSEIMSKKITQKSWNPTMDTVPQTPKMSFASILTELAITNPDKRTLKNKFLFTDPKYCIK